MLWTVVRCTEVARGVLRKVGQTNHRVKGLILDPGGTEAALFCFECIGGFSIISIVAEAISHDKSSRRQVPNSSRVVADDIGMQSGNGRLRKDVTKTPGPAFVSLLL
jgi:hypothetical protein